MWGHEIESEDGFCTHWLREVMRSTSHFKLWSFVWPNLNQQLLLPTKEILRKGILLLCLEFNNNNGNL